MGSCSGELKLYREIADWWPLFSPREDYAEEAEFFQRVFIGACETMPHTLLELGSGGGNTASFLKSRFQMTLVDLSPEMLEVSRGLNPECEHIQGDMRTIRLGRTFDGVFIHDAILYMTTERDLRQAIETAFVHCRPGGAAVFATDFVRETFRPSTDHGGCDGKDRSLRYLEWMWDPDPEDTTFLADFACLLRDSDGSVRVLQDRHTLGLFPRADWLRLLADVGFRPESVTFQHSKLDPSACTVFLARKPS